MDNSGARYGLGQKIAIEWTVWGVSKRDPKSNKYRYQLSLASDPVVTLTLDEEEIEAGEIKER